jgi:ABC-2 type transport system permease protein
MNKVLELGESVASWRMLLVKEVLRFWRVAAQTVIAPVITALLYLLIFSHVLESRVSVFGDAVSYTAFLVPGLIMMSVLQNAFANTSSSLIQSKVAGNIVFFLLAPITSWGVFCAYVLAAVLRGFMVGFGVFLVAALIYAPELLRPVAFWWIIIFAFLGSAIMAMLGIIAGLWADKFDQLATFSNFLITPLTFLSGVFYSIQSLPTFWQTASRFNPFLYMIDGFRYGFFGLSDTSIWLSFSIVLAAAVALSWGTWKLIDSGWKVRA